MPNLRETQLQIARDILAFARQQAPRAAATALLRVPPGVDPGGRLDVYRHGYPSRILEALRDAYPALDTILGEGSFHNLVRRYLAAIELRSYNLNDVGAQLPAHCRRDPLRDGLPFLGDLAELEWAVLSAYQSREKPPVDPQKLAGFDMADWETAVLELQPAVAVVSSQWPILDLLETKDIERDQIDVALEDRPQSVLVYRRRLEVEQRLVDAAEQRALQLLGSGTPLGEAIAELAADGCSPQATMEMFGNWVGAGLITSVRTNRPT